MPDELEGMAKFLFEMGLLKRSKRTGWWLAGVKDPESIAEHAFRTAVIGMLLAMLEGVDPGKVALLCLLHDTQESRLGDIPSVGRRYIKTASNQAVTADQVAAFPEPLAHVLRTLVDEYEDRESGESCIAHDADKLECLVQAREYEAQGYQDTPPWVETSAASLRTASAQRLAKACRAVPPKEWWRPFVEAYGRASSLEPGEGSAGDGS